MTVTTVLLVYVVVVVVVVVVVEEVSVQVKLIKMGGRLVRHSRWVIFQLSEVSVPRRLFEGVLDRIGRLSPAPS